MRAAVIGSTGLVGQKILQLLEERNFSIKELIPVASEKSKGKQIFFKGEKITLLSMEEAIAKRPHIAFFSVDTSISLNYAPQFAAVGTIVIDNSSAWRMDVSKKLIIPEVNGDILRIDDRIIANPNCSTIQMVMALNPLHHIFKIKRIVVSTYQSVTGSGQEAVNQLKNERLGKDTRRAYPHKIDLNIIPHIDEFQDNGYTKEEMKMVYETKKIMQDINNSIQITATCVRIPAIGGHSEAVNVEFEREYTTEQVYSVLSKTKGVTIVDNPNANEYPMPLKAHDQDDVYVGRIRRDESQPKTLNIWIVSDNLRKGAATNAIQIAEYMVEYNLIYG